MNLRVLIAVLCLILTFSIARSSLAADAPEFSIPFTMDAGGEPLDGTAHRYTLTFAANELPPAKSWELALYNLPQQEFVANAIHRHAIDSRMLPGLVRDKEGNVTIYIQRDPPRGKRKANWLPAADGPFLLQLRLFDAKQQVLDAAWEAPPVVRAD
jgi:hypothetical protein